MAMQNQRSQHDGKLLISNDTVSVDDYPETSSSAGFHSEVGTKDNSASFASSKIKNSFFTNNHFQNNVKGVVG
jgi:hypothetical protein